MTTTEDLRIIEQYIMAFSKLGMLAKFNPLARKHLSEDFTHERIKEKYKISYTNYIFDCCKPGTALCLSENYAAGKIKDLRIALQLAATGEVKKAIEDVQWADELLAKREAEATNAVLELIANEEATKQDTSLPATPLKSSRVEVAKKSVSAGIKFEVDVESILIDAAKAFLTSDEAGILLHVDKKIKEEALKLRPNQIIIGERPPVKMGESVHSCFKLLMEILIMEKQALLVGPAGTGKTTLASQAAQALTIPFGHISCTAGMSEAHLIGRMIADGSYIPSEFITIYEEGGVFLFDEIDAADPNTLLVINSGLANGYLSVPNRKDKPKAIRHKDCYIICAANTFGQGSNQYSGRSILDAAFLDRFCMAKLEVNYDEKLEKQILGANPYLASKLWKIRVNINNLKLRRVLSTRAFVSSAISHATGKGDKEILDRFFVGWAKEEQAKALQGV